MIQAKVNPETLAEAFRIATGDSPLIPERSHLLSLVLHGRAWNSTIMEASTPRKTIRCQHESCQAGYVPYTDPYGETKQTECPVCGGSPEIDYATVASYAAQIDELRKDGRELRKALEASERRAGMWKGLYRSIQRTNEALVLAKKPAQYEATVTAIEAVG